jgi:hypothetical protein
MWMEAHRLPTSVGAEGVGFHDDQYQLGRAQRRSFVRPVTGQNER